VTVVTNQTTQVSVTNTFVPLPTTGCDTLLDNFNRSGPSVGSNWSGSTSTSAYKLESQQVKVYAGGALIWKNSAFGKDQEACVTLTKLNSKGLHKVLLKVQDRDWVKGAIAVYYEAATGKVGIKTYRFGVGWKILATFSKTMQAGDRLSGQALADGTVKAFVNGQLVGQANAGSFFTNKGGYIGLWFVNSSTPQVVFDDFKGKSLSSNSSVTVTNTPSGAGEQQLYLPLVTKP
jgi:hypothetical protein